jgi:hypothetical protein
MDITIRLNCNGAAFDERAEDEIARILSNLADKMRNHHTVHDLKGAIRDINGNRCGQLNVTGG